MNKTPLNSCVCGTPGTIWAPLGAQYRAPLVKSEFFFCVFSRYLCDGEISVDPTLILQCRAPGLFIAKIIFREMFSALRKSGLLRHVTSRHVL